MSASALQSAGAMATIGLHCSHEQHAPSTLLRHAKRAAEAGFAAAMCSDHLQPWSRRQGHSGFAWSWLGAALEATPMSFGTVCAPGQRYHPVIVAQAAATLVELYGSRFWLAVGSGEALNEAVTGERWLPKPQRHARLEAAVEMMRALWAGHTLTYSGLLQARNARLHVAIDQPPLLVGAALSPDTAHWVARWADALITAAGEADAAQSVLDAFRDGGGGGKPAFLQMAVSYAPRQDEAEHAVFDQWRQCVLTSEQLADLRSPEEFDRATRDVPVQDVLKCIPASCEIERHVELIERYSAMGFDRVYLHNVARAHQERFIEACAPYLPAFGAATGVPL